MNPYSDADLLDVWRKTIDPMNVGMPEAISAEIASYTGEPVPTVLQRMSRGKDDFKQLWQDAGIDASNPAQVAAFYRDHLVEAYELAEWHCGRLNGHPPLTYAHAAMLARDKGLRRALDFGSGIGSGALCLTRAGCDVDCADISNTLLKFVGHRFNERRAPVTLIDLGTGQLPAKRTYDIITCFDVLEHVLDQEAELRKLESYLRVGGYLIVNFMNDSSHPDRPMHISSAGEWLALVRRTSLVPDWANFRLAGDHAQALVLQRWGRPRNAIASRIDQYQRSSAR